jgi:hypothetical protein
VEYFLFPIQRKAEHIHPATNFVMTFYSWKDVPSRWSDGQDKHAKFSYFHFSAYETAIIIFSAHYLAFKTRSSGRSRYTADRPSADILSPFVSFHVYRFPRSSLESTIPEEKVRAFRFPLLPCIPGVIYGAEEKTSQIFYQIWRIRILIDRHPRLIYSL